MTQPSDPPPNAFNSPESAPPTLHDVGNSDGHIHPQSGENLPEGANPSATREAFKKLYVILIVIGVVIGLFAAIGVVKVLNQWGLTDPPNRIEERTN